MTVAERDEARQRLVDAIQRAHAEDYNDGRSAEEIAVDAVLARRDDLFDALGGGYLPDPVYEDISWWFESQDFTQTVRVFPREA